ncbi:MAG: hypothetical protein VKK03_04900 [Synechococcus sp.]|nr:hypothetical protein [Synechococcus sp.]
MTKRLIEITSSAILVASVTGIAPAQARPWLYVSAFSYGGSGEACLTKAREALRKHGFTQGLEIDRFNSGEGGHVSGKMPGSAVLAKIECDQGLGVTALAVSGLDNDITYKKYSDLFDSKW